MPSLKIEITRNLTEVVELSGPITLGRGKENDIILLENVVSRKHSRVSFDGPDVIIEDLNSSNGTYVNDNRVFLRALQDKDKISVGNTKIWFSTEKLDKPPKEMDLTQHALSEFDLQELVTSRDISFKFPSDDGNINQIYEIARQKFESLPVTDMEKINLDAALNEAIGNAQRHGHKYNAELPIEFRYIHKQERLIVRITDQGEGFDYRAELQRKKAGTAVDEARARYRAGGYGGLGIMLMLKCVDSVEYNRKGNQVTLTKYLGEAAKKFKEEQKQRDAEEAQAELEGEDNDAINTDSEMQPEEIQPQNGIEITPEEGNKESDKEVGKFLIEPD